MYNVCHVSLTRYCKYYFYYYFFFHFFKILLALKKILFIFFLAHQMVTVIPKSGDLENDRGSEDEGIE